MKRFLLIFLVCFLPAFMILVFGPSEIYFANIQEFEFLFLHFFPWLLLGAFGLSLLLSLILFFLPGNIRSVILALITGISVAGYLQVNFLNGQLDLLGLNPEGYQVRGGGIVNLLIWVFILAVCVIISVWKRELSGKLFPGIAAFFLAIQCVALISLLPSADEKAWRYPEGTWHLTGKDQYTVASDKNVIVLVLDYFSNDYVEPMLAAYPDALDALHDFTFYDNTDCVYFGTFPSMTHMLTGMEVDPSILINDWCYKAWTDEKTERFYRELGEAGYLATLYTSDKNLLLGLNDVSLWQGKFDNISDGTDEVDVFYKLLFSTMTRMSCYRFAPELLKPPFYANLDSYYGIVEHVSLPVRQMNDQFYTSLLEEGLHTDKERRLIVQHLMGPHLYLNDAHAVYKEDATLEETCRGCIYLVEEYLEQMKKLGVYDDATIIITADHGDAYEPQVIFMVKEPGETHETMRTNSAPLSLHDLLPTLAVACGLDAAPYGRTIYDFAEGEERERTYWLRWVSESYPSVKRYDGRPDASTNCYALFPYVGDKSVLEYILHNGSFETIPMADSYF